MKIKRFFANDMRTALTQVKDELGPDAVIMSNKKVSGGVEIVAAYEDEQETQQFSKSHDYDDENVTISSRGIAAAKSQNSSMQSGGFGQPAAKSPKTRAEKNNAQLADTLSELLARQKNAKTNQTGKQSFSSLQNQDVSGPKTLAEQESLAGRFSANSAAAQNPVKASADPALAELQQEVANIRKLLQSQLAGLMTEKDERNEPIKAMIVKLLIKGGFAENFAQALANDLPAAKTLRQSWKDLENILVRNMLIGNNEILRQGGAVTLVGPTGVGKTTTIAKLAAHFSMKYGADQVALVTTDNYRIGAYEQLQTYGRIMGCAVKSLSNMNDMQNVLYQLRNKRLVLIDTAGIRETMDPVEKIGVERSVKARREADASLLIIDGSAPLNEDDRSLLLSFTGEGAVVINKTDLPQKVTEDAVSRIRPDIQCMTVSALDTESLQPLRNYLSSFVSVSEQQAITQPRHLAAVKRALFHLKEARRTIELFTPDVAATDLQAAQEALSEITGDRADEKLLDRVFSQFCVGK